MSETPKCKVCDNRKAATVFNIGGKQVPICEECADSIFLQQGKWYTTQEKEGARLTEIDIEEAKVDFYTWFTKNVDRLNEIVAASEFMGMPVLRYEGPLESLADKEYIKQQASSAGSSNTRCLYFPNANSTGMECVHCGQSKYMHK